MIHPDYIREGASRARKAGGGLSLACLLLLCPGVTYARQTPPPAPKAPAAAPNAPVAEAPARVDATPPAQRTLPASPAQSPAAPAPPARPMPPRKASAPIIVPPEVVTVVHRLSGWKLLAWLATTGPPTLELAEWPSHSDAHTNIVAGYVYGDGRSVVARLPQAEVELAAFNAPTTPPPFFTSAQHQAQTEPEYLLVTADGKRFEAKFVGLDSSTGLALLEAGERLLAGAPTGDAGDTDDPTVGQRVRLYAPIPAIAPPAPAARPAPPAPQEQGYVYLSIDQKEGRLTRLYRTPSGTLSSVIVSANLSPAWVGAVAANELGEVVGIVSQSREGETRILPMTAVRDACERVLKLRGTVPQPWLGARGDAVAQFPLQSWVEQGWTPEAARPFIAKRQGVFLTSVAPGTPAARAGLRAGDLITSVGPRVVRGNEDFSMTLLEAGVGSVVDMTVWRARTPEPLKFSVELKGAKNPAVATAEAEERALLASLLGSEREIREMRAAEVRIKSAAAASRAADLARLTERINVTEARAQFFRQQLEQKRALLGGVNFFNFEPSPLIGPQPRRRDDDVTRRLKAYGLNAIGLSTRSAAPLGAQGGLLVVAVQPDSPAAESGLLAGDVIETVNGSPLWRAELRRLTNTDETTNVVFGLVRGGRRLSVNFSPSPAAEPQQR